MTNTQTELLPCPPREALCHAQRELARCLDMLHHVRGQSFYPPANDVEAGMEYEHLLETARKAMQQVAQAIAAWNTRLTARTEPDKALVERWREGVNYGLQAAFLAARGTNSDLCKSPLSAYRNILECLRELTADNIPDCYRPGPAIAAMSTSDSAGERAQIVAGEWQLERVTQAIADAQFGGPFNGLEWPEAWAHFETLARAALASLKETNHDQ